MKFKKLLFIGIGKSALEDSYWEKIDRLTEKKVFVDKDSAEIRKELPNTDGVLVNFGVPFTKDDIDAVLNLKYIGTLSTAFGKVDANYARQKGIPVCNLAGYSTESVAEFTLAAILEAIRGLETGKQRGRKLNVDESGIKAWEIKDKVFGILGLGSIGRRVAELALGFEADVRYWSKHRKKDADKRGIKYQNADSQNYVTNDFSGFIQFFLNRRFIYFNFRNVLGNFADFRFVSSFNNNTDCAAGCN